MAHFYSTKQISGTIYVSAEGPLYTVRIDECIFINNVAGSFGGAVSVTGHHWLKYVIFSKCYFFGN